MRAADSVADLVTGRLRELKGDGYGEFGIFVCDEIWLKCAANHRNIPMLQSGTVNWSQVSRVKILAIQSSNV